jgi:DNA-binding transcriptional MocR family regulator
LRQALKTQQAAAFAAIKQHFPAGVRVATPEGGYFLWLELPESVDALDVHRRAIEAHISIAPGPMFSARRQFRHCLRLNYGHPWTEQVDTAVAELGRIVTRLDRSA